MSQVRCVCLMQLVDLGCMLAFWVPACHAVLLCSANDLLLRMRLPNALALSCRLLGAAADAAHSSMMTRLLDQYEQKDNLARQLEGITKMEVGGPQGSSRLEDALIVVSFSVFPLL